MSLSQEEKDHIKDLEARLDDPHHGSIVYEYQYLDGEQEKFEVFQRMSDEPLVIHNNRPCQKIVSSCQILSDVGVPKTIGALAEKNTERMIKEGSDKIKKPGPNPWWRPNSRKPKNIRGWTKQQINRYITHGR